ncbi:hypothetical protein FA13DRAFT_1776502 [Coprinellus micaceus]|uniref:Uncharacterized protein n=1 Tax=Coprinellus micaceus TaxID=71717 RepID=A0A4Y7T038_COPMI|nr:hypothetical protein FA13DRAFT_1776502 [Coprinellus micaceus]
MQSEAEGAQSVQARLERLPLPGPPSRTTPPPPPPPRPKSTHLDLLPVGKTQPSPEANTLPLVIEMDGSERCKDTKRNGGGVLWRCVPRCTDETGFVIPSAGVQAVLIQTLPQLTCSSPQALLSNDRPSPEQDPSTKVRPLSNSHSHPRRIQEVEVLALRVRSFYSYLIPPIRPGSSINTSKLRAAQVPPKDVLRDIKRTTWLSGSSYFDQALLHYPNREDSHRPRRDVAFGAGRLPVCRVMEGALGVKGTRDAGQCKEDGALRPVAAKNVASTAGNSHP